MLPPNGDVLMGILDHILLGFEAVLYGSGAVSVLGIGVPLPLLMVFLGACHRHHCRLNTRAGRAHGHGGCLAHPDQHFRI